METGKRLSRRLSDIVATNDGTPSHRVVLISRAVAIIADALQLVLFPFFVEGFGSVLNDVLDVVVCAVLVWLIGWNPLFLPTFVVEILPFGDLAPTWTIAVLIATRSRNAAPPGKGLPSEHGEGPPPRIDAA
jgi:hypothetical protein